MQTPNRVNPATDQGKSSGKGNMAEDLSKSSPEELGAKTNSALTRAPSEGMPKFGSDEEFSTDRPYNSSSKQGTQFKDVTRRAREIGSKVADGAQEYGKKAMEQTGSYVKEHPIRIVAGCLGIGMIAGGLTGYALGRR